MILEPEAFFSSLKKKNRKEKNLVIIEQNFIQKPLLKMVRFMKRINCRESSME